MISKMESQKERCSHLGRITYEEQTHEVVIDVEVMKNKSVGCTVGEKVSKKKEDAYSEILLQTYRRPQKKMTEGI